MSSRTLVKLGALLILIGGAVATAGWFLSTPAEPVVDKEQQERNERAALGYVALKDRSLATLENGKFQEAEPQLLELATLGIKEPIGARNWLVNRIAEVGRIDLAKDPDRYAAAVARGSEAVELESRLEREGPVRYYLASKIAGFAQNPAKQFQDLHLGAGRGPDYPLIWNELYLAERDFPDEAIRADGENALKTLYDFLPNNTYVLLEWLNIAARRKNPEIVEPLERAKQQLVPFLGDVPAATPVAPAQAIDLALAAAKKGDWNGVATNLKVVNAVAALQPAVRNDKWRVDHGLQWLIKYDFSDKFYQDRLPERVLPKKDAPVHFRDLALKGPLAGMTDIRDARLVDLDGDGRLEMAILRKASLEAYRRGSSVDEWTRLAEVPLPEGGFERVAPAELDGDAKPSLILYGSAGVVVVESQRDPAGKTLQLKRVETSALTEKSKGAESVLAVDLDHDGLLDLVVAKPAEVSVWRNGGHQEFIDVTPRSGLAEPKPATRGEAPARRSLAVIDYNHDCDADVLLSGGAAKGANLLYGLGEGRFRVSPLANKDAVMQQAVTVAVLDADANGSCDVLAAGPGGIALLQTSSTDYGQVDVVNMGPVADFAANQLLVLDYDNDGSQDVLAANADAIQCLHGTGNGQFEAAPDVLPAGLGAVHLADSGDIDDDGDLDILVVSKEPSGGRLHILQNDGGNANNWIDVRLNGVPATRTDQRRASASAVGATVILKCGAVCQSRIVTGPLTHFGIGSRDAADFLRIVWPIGIPTNIEQPAKNRVIPAGPPPASWR
jgi:FG-GAP-like repeat